MVLLYKEYIGFVYVWTNIINNKKYIGLHVGKITDNYIGSGKLFKKAIKKYGIDKFHRKIIYYEYNNIDNLYQKEHDIINFYNAVNDETYYNLTNYDPKNIIEGVKHRVVLEETKNKIRKYRTGNRSSEKTKRKMSQVQRNLIFINNGIKETKISKENIIPVGWSLGRLYKNKIKRNTKGMKWYNNGIKDCQFFSGEEPEGWIKGRIHGLQKCIGNLENTKGTKWYNNGIKTKQYIQGKEPAGWKLGFLNTKLNSYPRNKKGQFSKVH